jgi:hypothetical protein
MVLVRTLERETQKGLYNFGTWGIRDKRGKPGNPSVHATGRAADVAWREIPGERGGTAEWQKQPYRNARAIINRLVEHADAIGLELALDYTPQPYGAGWRCDRGTWERYEKPTIHGAPGGQWFHLEISPAMAANPEGMKAGLLLVFPPNPPKP